MRREATSNQRNVGVFAAGGGTSKKERFVVVQNVEGMRKPVACLRLNGGMREATSGRIVVLPQVQAAEDVRYTAEVARPEPSQDGRRMRRSCRGLELMQGGRTHEDVRSLEVATTTAAEPQVRPRPELAFYRKYTEAMLRRYVKMSTEVGRTPSLLGREMFRAKVTSYRVKSFEDVVVFCMDVERCVARLSDGEKQLIKRVAMQEYSQGEAAGILGLSLRGVVQQYGSALDRLTGIFLAAGMMEPLRKLAQAYEAGSAKE